MPIYFMSLDEDMLFAEKYKMFINWSENGKDTEISVILENINIVFMFFFLNKAVNNAFFRFLCKSSLEVLTKYYESEVMTLNSFIIGLSVNLKSYHEK